MTRRDMIESLFMKGYDIKKMENLKDKKLIQLYNQTFDEKIKKIKKSFDS